MLGLLHYPGGLSVNGHSGHWAQRSPLTSANGSIRRSQTLSYPTAVSSGQSGDQKTKQTALNHKSLTPVPPTLTSLTRVPQTPTSLTSVPPTFTPLTRSLRLSPL